MFNQQKMENSTKSPNAFKDEKRPDKGFNEKFVANKPPISSSA